MVTDDTLEEMASYAGCEVEYLGNELWQCYDLQRDVCRYGDFGQIYQLLEDLVEANRSKDIREHSREYAAALKAHTPVAVDACPVAG